MPAPASLCDAADARNPPPVPPPPRPRADDIVDLEVYNTTTFNSFLHLAMMSAAVELANHVGDAATAAAAAAALARGQAAVTALLWNSTYGYFRAFTGGDAIMADCLYGQVVAHHLGLGWLVPPDLIASHLAAELKYNGNPYGLTVITGRHTPPPDAAAGAPRAPRSRRAVAAAAGAAGAVASGALSTGVDTEDDTNWMGAAPDWSYLALALGAAGPTGGNVTAALAVAARSLDNWRTRLADLWNIAGLTSTADWGDDNANGQPWITSHYGFMLVDYYLLPALSGQATNIPNGTLTFAPLLPCPYTVPVLLTGTEGTLTCAPGGGLTLTIAFGTLTLPPGGLAAGGRAYPGAVTLSAGESVSW
jgi:hypothetical protein